MHESLEFLKYWVNIVSEAEENKFLSMVSTFRKSNEQSNIMSLETKCCETFARGMMSLNDYLNR